MDKLLDLKGLTHLLNKAKDLLKKEKDKLNNKIDTNKTDADKKIEDLNTRVDVTDSNVNNVKGDVDEIKDKINNGEIGGSGTGGDVININEIEQFVFENIRAGEVVEITINSEDFDSFIQCFGEIEGDEIIERPIVSIDKNSGKDFVYDDTLVEFTDDGVKLKNTNVFNYRTVKENAYYTLLESEPIKLSGFNEIKGIEEVE